jgi:hypothetical protein
MNFKLHERDLRRLLTIPGQRENEGHKGCYIIQRDDGDDSYKIGVSYGRAGLWRRLKDYKICFPFLNEFYVNYIITSPTSADAKKLEKLILARRELERIERNPDDQGLTSNEYRFVTSVYKLKKVILAVADKNRDLWSAIVVLGPNGWRVYRNERTRDGRRYKKIAALVKPSTRTMTMENIF